MRNYKGLFLRAGLAFVALCQAVAVYGQGMPYGQGIPYGQGMPYPSRVVVPQQPCPTPLPYTPGAMPLPHAPSMPPSAMPLPPGTPAPSTPGTTPAPTPGTTPTPMPGTTPAPAPGTAPTPGAAPTPDLSAPAPSPGAGSDAFAQASAAGTGETSTGAPNLLGDLVGGGVFETVIFNPNLVTQRRVLVASGSATPFVSVVTTRGGTQRVRIPQLARGSFKIAENESPRPQDRVFFNYNYFNNVGVTSSGGSVNGPDLHRETFGFEKTFFDGNFSFGLRAPIFQSRGGDGSLSQSDFGDLTLIGKYALLNDRQTGDVLSLGLVVTTPTGPDATLSDGTTIHPTLLQPFVGYIFNMDRVYVHGFSAVIVPTDSRDVTLLSNDIGLGYRWRRPNEADGSMITSITPTLEAHLTTPLNHRGSVSSNELNFPDVLVFTTGVHLGLGQRSTLTLGAAVPVTGPKLFDWEALVQFNFNF